MKSRYSMERLKFSVLKSLSNSSSQNKFNMLGRPDQGGSLESDLGMKFTDEERALAGIAIAQLKQSGHIQPTYKDITNPEDWLELTDKGQLALTQNALDELDVALSKIDPKLCELRHGATQSLLSGDPDAKRQASHSARELIRQVLEILAPSEEIKAHQEFQPSEHSKDGITRQMRIKFAIKKRRSGFSESDAEVIEATCKLIDSLYSKLSGEAHRDVRGQHGDIETLINLTETILKKLLL